MKTILYLAVSLNGYIAKENDNVDWVSEAQWRHYRDMLKRTKNAIVGRRTYKLMAEDEFIKECDFYVLTSDKTIKSKYSNIHIFKDSPKKLIEELEKNGAGEVLIAGGGRLNSSFIKEGLINEIFLDMEPIILGKGIPLFREDDFETRLKLIGSKKIDNLMQLHYEVI